MKHNGRQRGDLNSHRHVQGPSRKLPTNAGQGTRNQNEPTSTTFGSHAPHDAHFFIHDSIVFWRRTFFCNCMRPYSRASAVGGQPGTYTSTGTMRSQPRTTEYE